MKSVKTCRTSRDFERAVTSQGGHVESGGKHAKLALPGGQRVPYPTHGGDIPTGTRCSIIKVCLAAGLACVPFACMLLAGVK